MRNQTVLTHCDKRFGARKRRLNQKFGGVTGRVGLLLGDQLDFELLGAPLGRCFGAGDPDAHLAAIRAAVLVVDQRSNAPGAALSRLKFAALRAAVGRQLTCRLIALNLLGLAIYIRPFEARGADLNLAPAQKIAVDIADDCLNLDGLTFADKRLFAAYADIGFGRMHEQVGLARPGLAVDISDRAAGRNRIREGRLCMVEMDVEMMLAGGVGMALPGLGGS